MGRGSNPNSMFMKARHEFERELLMRVIAQTGNNKMETARQLGISYATLKTVLGRAKNVKVSDEMAPLVGELKEVVWRRIKGDNDGRAGQAELQAFLERIRNEVKAEFQAAILAHANPGSKGHATKVAVAPVRRRRRRQTAKKAAKVRPRHRP